MLPTTHEPEKTTLFWMKGVHINAVKNHSVIELKQTISWSMKHKHTVEDVDREFRLLPQLQKRPC